MPAQRMRFLLALPPAHPGQRCFAAGQTRLFAKILKQQITSCNVCGMALLREPGPRRSRHAQQARLLLHDPMRPIHPPARLLCFTHTHTHDTSVKSIASKGLHARATAMHVDLAIHRREAVAESDSRRGTIGGCGEPGPGRTGGVEGVQVVETAWFWVDGDSEVTVKRGLRLGDGQGSRAGSLEERASFAPHQATRPI
jgi:hypothetical protein